MYDWQPLNLSQACAAANPVRRATSFYVSQKNSHKLTNQRPFLGNESTLLKYSSPGTKPAVGGMSNDQQGFWSPKQAWAEFPAAISYL